MEVDNEYDWLTEQACFKPVDGTLPVSKRQQQKGLGPSVYISSFNSIQALEKNYLAQLPSNSLSVMCLHLYFSHCSPIEFGPDILSMVF